MKLTVNENPDFKETEIIINCTEATGRLEQLIRQIRQYSFTLQGKTESGVCFLPAEEIYYIDSVDSKTFLYAKNAVYGCGESLAELEVRLAGSSFVRISKNCIVNTGCLESVKPLWNHRLEAALTNGEKLVVTRHYIESLKEKIMD